MVGQTGIEQTIDELSIALANCNDRRLINRFFHDLLTKHEIRDIALRWRLVHLIDEGYTQREVATRLGISLCKVTRGAKELKKVDTSFSKLLKLTRDERKLNLGESENEKVKQKSE